MMMRGDKDSDAPSCNGQRGVRSLFPKHTTVEIEASDFQSVRQRVCDSFVGEVVSLGVQ